MVANDPALRSAIATAAAHRKAAKYGNAGTAAAPRRWETDGYVDLIGMDKSLRAQVLAAVLAAYQDHSGE